MFIKLTDNYNNEFYLNVANIVSIDISLSGSLVTVLGNDSQLTKRTVQETPEEIVELIEKQNGDN